MQDNGLLEPWGIIYYLCTDSISELQIITYV